MSTMKERETYTAGNFHETHGMGYRPSQQLNNIYRKI